MVIRIGLSYVRQSAVFSGVLIRLWRSHWHCFYHGGCFGIQFVTQTTQGAHPPSLVVIKLFDLDH